MNEQNSLEKDKINGIGDYDLKKYSSESGKNLSCMILCVILEIPAVGACVHADQAQRADCRASG